MWCRLSRFTRWWMRLFETLLLRGEKKNKFEMNGIWNWRDKNSCNAKRVRTGWRSAADYLTGLASSSARSTGTLEHATKKRNTHSTPSSSSLDAANTHTHTSRSESRATCYLSLPLHLPLSLVMSTTYVQNLGCCTCTRETHQRPSFRGEFASLTAADRARQRTREQI